MHRFHKECVELWESLPPESKLHPETWAYNHIVMSYVKDGMGILRWPKKESDLKRRIKDIYLRCAQLPRPWLLQLHLTPKDNRDLAKWQGNKQGKAEHI